MKNYFRISTGLLVFIFILILTNCASIVPPPNWENDTPKDQRVVLYYPSDFQVEQINGVTKSLGPVARVYSGNGDDWENSKQSLQIPPGQTTIRMQYKGSGLMSAINTQVTYNFQPGGHYRLIPSLKDGVNVRDALQISVSGTNEEVFNWKIDKIK